MQQSAERARKQFFWWIDFLKGKSFRREYDDIAMAMEGGSAVALENENRLERILQHASKTTPYYKVFKGRALQDYPIIDKHVIRSNNHSFLSESFDSFPLFKVVTSGSTGTPFVVYHNPRKRARNTADTIYFSERAGFELGNRLYYFKIWNEINKKSWIKEFVQNIVPCNVLDLSDDGINHFITRLNGDSSTIGLLGYASAYGAICSFMERNPGLRVRANVKSAIAMSEAMSVPVQLAMQEHFGCPCISRYSNVENGILAQQVLGGGQDFQINTASYWIELLNVHDDQPCRMGETGRIVVTDLFNEAMPLIRYDTGDLGVLKQAMTDGLETRVIERIEGRLMDMIYDTEDALLSSFTVTNNMWKYTELKQYQFIQTGKASYLFRLNCDRPFLREGPLLSEFRSYLGQGASIEVEYVDEIPVLASGKRKMVKNDWNTSR